MSRDHSVYWRDERPTLEQVRFVCEDYVRDIGTVEWSESDHGFLITLPGLYSDAAARIEFDGFAPGAPKGALGRNGRWIEVTPGGGGRNEPLDVRTSQQDEITNVIAEGLADVFARLWHGQRDVPALCRECGGDLGGAEIGRLENHKGDCSRLPL